MKADDFAVFGDCIVYCDQHLAPYRTGWCTVNPRNKTKLDAKEVDAEAAEECRVKGFKLYSDIINLK